MNNKTTMEMALDRALEKAQTQEKAREEAQEEAKKKNGLKAGFSDQDAETLVKTTMGEDVFKRGREEMQNINNKSMADKTNQEFIKKPEDIKNTETQKDPHSYGGAVGHQIKELSDKLKTAEMIDKKGTREQIEENEGRVEFFKKELDKARQAGEAGKEIARKKMEKAIEEKKRAVDNQAKAGEEKVKESGGAPGDVEAAKKAGAELKDEAKSSAEKAEEAIKEEVIKERALSDAELIKKGAKYKEGLGAEKNKKIAKYLMDGNYGGLLQIISQEQDKQAACEVIQNSIFDFNQGSREESINQLSTTALNNLGQYGAALKELIIYSWRNDLQGERFWKNPNKNETLFVDDDGELVSFQGEIGTSLQGDSKGMNYIKTLGKYEILTGPNTGKVFDGSYEAGQRHDPSYRPIKGPEFKEENKIERLGVSPDGAEQVQKEMEEAVSRKTKEFEGQTKKGEEKSVGEMAEDVKGAQKAGEELKDEAKSSAEKAEEVIKKEEIKTPEELLKDIGGKRSAYVEAEKKLNEARKNNAEGLAVFEHNFQKTRFEYENSRARYAHDLYLNKIELLKANGLSETDPRYRVELNSFMNDLHRDVLLNEHQRLINAKSENMTPLKRTWFRSTLEKFGKMPRWQRVLISTGLVTGAAVAGGGLGLAAAAAFGGGRFAKGMLFGALAGKSAGLVKTIGGGRTEEWLRRQDQNLRTQFEVDLRSDIAANDFEMFRNNFNRLFAERNQVLQEVNRRHRNINLLAAGTAVLIGGTAAMSLSSSGASSLFEQKGSGFSVKDVFGGGGKTTSFGFPATTDHTLGVKMGPPYDIKEALSAAKLNEIVVGKGDNLWNIIDKKLENIYDIKYEGLGEARQAYVIDSIKDEIARNPGAYGLQNIDQLQPGQKIDLSGVIADHKMTHLFDNAKHLTDAQLRSISGHLTEQVSDISGKSPIFVPEDAAEKIEEISGAGKTIELAPENKMHAIASKLYLSEQRGLDKVINSLGGKEKFLDMPASSLFYQEGAELDVFREKLGLQLKQLTGDSYKLHDNVTSIRKVLESIDASKLPEAVKGAEESINMTEGTVEKLKN